MAEQKEQTSVFAQLHLHEGRTAIEIAQVLDVARQAVVNALVALQRAGKAERVAPEGVAGYPGAKDGVSLWFRRVVSEDDRLVTVCSACLQASCWQGIVSCDDAVNAGRVDYTVAELRKLGREHPDYWKSPDPRPSR